MGKKRVLCSMLTLALTVLALGGCQVTTAPSSSSSVEPASSGSDASQGAASQSQAPAEGGGWTGEIRFYAQGYTPKTPDAVNPNPPTMLQTFADEYAAQHPGVTITFIDLPGDAVRAEWIRTQAAAGQLPDVVYELSHNVGSQLPKEMFQPIDPYLERDTPYVPGKKWGETFNDVVLQVTQIGDGAHYVISGDYVETGIYYNKKMFADAGITDLPKNWEEFVEAGKQLKDAGFTPLAWSMAQDDTYALDWCNRIFLSNFYANDMDKIDVDGVRGVSTMEQVIALKNGMVRVDDGKFLGYFDLLKDYTPYMNSSWAAKSDLEKKFLSEEVAMYWTGSWLPKKMVDAGVNFEYGSFPFPTPTPATLPPHSTAAVTSGAVGGPSGAFQYCLSSPQANKTMTPEKADAVIDWMMYITEPGRISEIVNEVGTFYPTIVGSVSADGAGGLMDNFNADYRNYNGGQGLNGTIYDTTFRYLHQYMLGEVTKEKMIADLTKVYDEELDAIIADNPDWDLEAYLK